MVGWRVDRDGSYFCLVPGCSSQLITERHQFEAHWKEVHHPATTRVKCSQRCCAVQTPSMYTMRHHLREMHGIPLQQTRTTMFEEEEVENPKFLDTKELVSPSQSCLQRLSYFASKWGRSPSPTPVTVRSTVVVIEEPSRKRKRGHKKTYKSRAMISASEASEEDVEMTGSQEKEKRAR